MAICKPVMAYFSIPKCCDSPEMIFKAIAMALHGFVLSLLVLPHLLSFVTAQEVVSITIRHVHTCVSQCVYETRWSTDFGRILRCGAPYLNDCYCATSTSALSRVDEWATSCAIQSCNEGDFSNDLKGIKSAYRSYCAGAGYDQPGLEDWYTPAQATADPTSEGDGDGGAVTTMELTVVTQTASGDGNTLTPSLVVVHATSTRWVDSNGSPIPAPSSNGSGSGINTVALGAGLGAGLGIVLVAILGLIVWFCIRRRNRRERAELPSIPQPGFHQTSMAVIPGPSPMPIAPVVGAESGQRLSRKPVPSATTLPSPVSELNSQNFYPELANKSISPRPVSPLESSEPSRTEFRAEHYAAGTSELYGQGGNPPPHYHQLENTHRTELP